MPIALSKEEMRQRIKLAKQAFSAEQKKVESHRIWSKIEAHKRFQNAKTILLFHSLSDEPHTHEILESWSSQKKILLPVVAGDDLLLRVYSPTGAYSKGSFGIQEPIGEDFTDYNAIDLAIIPGVAFDTEGHRLGRGRGYYDRLLSRHEFSAYTIGVCFSFQLQPAVPTAPMDWSVNEVCTGNDTPISSTTY